MFIYFHHGHVPNIQLIFSIFLNFFKKNQTTVHYCTVFADVVELTEAVGAVTDDCEIGKDREGLQLRPLASSDYIFLISFDD